MGFEERIDTETSVKIYKGTGFLKAAQSTPYFGWWRSKGISVLLALLLALLR